MKAPNNVTLNNCVALKRRRWWGGGVVVVVVCEATKAKLKQNSQASPKRKKEQNKYKEPTPRPFSAEMKTSATQTRTFVSFSGSFLYSIETKHGGGEEEACKAWQLKAQGKKKKEEE